MRSSRSLFLFGRVALIIGVFVLKRDMKLQPTSHLHNANADFLFSVVFLGVVIVDQVYTLNIALYLFTNWYTIA